MTETPRFKKGDRVVLLRACYGLADWSGMDDQELPVGTVGTVTEVRPVEDPRNVTYQGPWLYDVSFPVKVTLPPDWEPEEGDPAHWRPGMEVEDVCWCIFDAQDVGDLAVQPTALREG